jgi:hypothetical protein
MAREPMSVDQAIARFDELVHRMDGGSVEARQATRRSYGRSAQALGKRIANIGMALGALIVATLAFAMIVGPIGLSGLFVISALTVLVLIFFSVWPKEPERPQFTDRTPTRDIVRGLDSFLVRERSALPAPATRKVDQISAQLPLLESRLAEVDMMDPLAQEARRLMGKHLPELIERYERVPSEYRSRRDGEGMSVDERLTAGLEAAREAIDDLGAKLARGDMDAFETQGRFIESRYKDGGELKSE